MHSVQSGQCISVKGLGPHINKTPFNHVGVQVCYSKFDCSLIR